jgi:hypothetical protein
VACSQGGAMAWGSGLSSSTTGAGGLRFKVNIGRWLMGCSLPAFKKICCLKILNLDFCFFNHFLSVLANLFGGG